MGKKKLVNDLLGTISTHTSLAEVVAWVEEMRIKADEEGWEGVNLQVDDEYGHLSIVLSGQRPETNAERDRRVRRELKARAEVEEAQKKTEEKDRKVYEALKAEYGWD